ncbi:MAG: O-antigen ligase [Pseudomonadota bacterium]
MSVAAAEPGFAPAPRARRDPVLLRFGPHLTLTLLHADLALITLWFIVTAAKFPMDELLLYPMALYFTASFFIWREATWPVLQRGFLLTLLPAWWMLSAIWSPEPMLAFRSGLQSLLTILICMFIASRMTKQQFFTVILVAVGVLAIRCLPQSLLDFSLGKPSKAIFPHKNMLGLAMTVSFAISMAVLLSATARPFVKLIALGLAPITLFLVFASQSATAILISIGAAGLIVGSQIFLGPRNEVTPPRVLMMAAAIAAAAIAALWAFNFLHQDPIDLVLGALGKNRGLTGRTELWEIGVAKMAERPFFGVGAQGFWRYDESSEVRQIFYDYFKKRGDTFYFHNSWLEIGVSFGGIGVFFAASAFGWAFLTAARRAIVIGGSENWALLAIGVAILVRTMTESDLFAQFSMLYMLFWVGVLTQPPPTASVAPQAEPGEWSPPQRRVAFRP